MTSRKSPQLLPVVLKSRGSQFLKYRCLFSTEADTHELCIAISYYLLQENCYSDVCASILVGGGAFFDEYKIMSQVVTNAGQNS